MKNNGIVLVFLNRCIFVFVVVCPERSRPVTRGGQEVSGLRVGGRSNISSRKVRMINVAILSDCIIPFTSFD